MLVRAFLAQVVVIALLLVSTGAWAADEERGRAKTTVAVLSFDSEDLEDQAEALSGALRSRLRASPVHALADSSTSLSLLIAALKCPSHPDAACLLRIGDQLKVDAFFWGTLAKSGPRTVTSEVHLWARGKPDAVAKETFSDNLRDQNDEVLKRIAGRIFDKLTGAPVAGILTVRAGEAEGSVLLDGVARGLLEHGQSVLELRPGSYTVEVRVVGYKPASHHVLVASGADLVLNLTLVPEKAVVAEKPARPISGRTIVTLGIIGAGLGFGVAGTVEGVSFLSKQSKNDEHHKTLGASDFCDLSQPHTGDPEQLGEACQNLKDAKSALVLEAVFYSVSAVLLGTGVVLLITDRDEPKAETAGKLEVKPRAGVTSAGLDLRMAF